MKKMTVTLSLLGMILLGALTPVRPVAAACDDGVLGFPPWFAGLTKADCSIKPICEKGEGECNTAHGAGVWISLSEFIFVVVLNVINILLVAVSYLSVGFVMYGGVKYMTSQGSPDKIAGAKKTIMAAVIGLVITILAASIITYLRGRLFI